MYTWSPFLTSIFEAQPPKTRASLTKTRGPIWIPGCDRGRIFVTCIFSTPTTKPNRWRFNLWISSVMGSIPSSKLLWQWIITIFNRYLESGCIFQPVILVYRRVDFAPQKSSLDHLPQNRSLWFEKKNKLKIFWEKVGTQIFFQFRGNLFLQIGESIPSDSPIVHFSSPIFFPGTGDPWGRRDSFLSDLTCGSSLTRVYGRLAEVHGELHQQPPWRLATT